MTLRVYQKESDAWIPVAPATTIEGRVATGEATQQAILATQVEMQTTINNALIDQARIKASPPGVAFMYQSGSSGLKEKYFQFWGSGSDTRMRLSAKGWDIDWLHMGINNDYYMENGPYFTIWYLESISHATDRPKWRQKVHGRINRIDWHDNDALVYISSKQTSGSLTENAVYNITIGGVM